MVSPPTWNVRPLTPLAASVHNHTTRGEILAGGWTLDALDAVAPTHLVEDLTNDSLLEDHPELQVFEP